MSDRDERHVPPMMCATCKRELRVTENFDQAGRYIGYELAHNVAIEGTAPHPIDPVVITDENELIEVCDFCSDGPLVGWVYPASDFQDVDIVGGDGVPQGFKSIGDWGACQACHEDIENENFEGVFERQVAGMLRRREITQKMVSSPAMRDHWVQTNRLWRGFMEHRLGPAYRDHA